MSSSNDNHGGGGGGGGHDGGGGAVSRERGEDRLDRALRSWPEPTRSPLEWDESAGAVMARVKAARPSLAAGVSDEALMAAPLPAGDDEVASSAPSSMSRSNPSTRQSRLSDRASLKELAKLAETAPPSSHSAASAGRVSQPPAPSSGRYEASEPRPAAPEREENSGIIHLAALTAGAAPVDEVVAPATSGAHPAAVPMTGAPVGPAPAAGTKTGSANERRSSAYVIGALVAAAAVAAGVFVGFKRPQTDPASTAAAPAIVGVGEGMGVGAPPAGANPSSTAATGKPAAVGTPIAAADRGVDPMTLPPADPAAQGGAMADPASPGRKSGPSGAAATPAPVAPAATAAASVAPDPKLVAVVPSPSAGAAEPKSLEALMQQAAGTTSAATPAAPPPPRTARQPPRRAASRSSPPSGRSRARSAPRCPRRALAWARTTPSPGRR